MTLELWNTYATFGTFVVIAATAIAALVQLRHARGSNQIAAIAELLEAENTPQFGEASRFVMTELPTKLKDPEFRYQLANPQTRSSENQTLFLQRAAVGNHYEQLGLLVKTGLVDQNLAMSIWSSTAFATWQRLAPSVSIARRTRGKASWENFEFVAVLSQDWIVAHPEGDYPKSVRRFDLSDEWLDADAKYAGSRAPA